MEKLRLLVLVDLPNRTRHERKAKREYLEWLHKHGYTPLQEGVYTRLANGRTNAEMHEHRLRSQPPELGSARLFTMTERQFREGKLFAGEECAQELEIGSELDIFL